MTFHTSILGQHPSDAATRTLGTTTMHYVEFIKMNIETEQSNLGVKTTTQCVKNGPIMEGVVKMGIL